MVESKVLRWSLVLAVALHLSGPAIMAQDPPKDPGEMTDEELEALLNDPLAEELAALLIEDETKGAPKWTHVVTLEMGAGIKDNVALSPVRPETSPLFRGLFDYIVIRDDSDGLEAFLYGSWEDFRFTNSEVDKEQTGLLMANFKRRYESGWDVGWSGQYIYQSQVLDLSTELAFPFALNVQGHTYLTSLTARRYLKGRYWADVRMELSRQDFAGPIDDYWDYSPRIEFAKWWQQNHVSLSYTFHDRPYDNRAEPNAGGGPIPGTELEFNVHRLQLEWKQDWGRQRAWQTRTRLRRELYFDNGSGFFKYRRWRVGEKVRYRRGDWTVNAEFDWSVYNYPNQLAVVGLPTRRRRQDWNFTLRIDRRLGKFWSGYVSYNYELSDSNQFASTYDATVVHAGLVFER